MLCVPHICSAIPGLNRALVQTFPRKPSWAHFIQRNEVIPHVNIAEPLIIGCSLCMGASGVFACQDGIKEYKKGKTRKGIIKISLGSTTVAVSTALTVATIWGSEYLKFIFSK